MATFPPELAACTGFDWDAGNATKNWDQHQVSQAECEQAFFNRPARIVADVGHSQREVRYAMLGATDTARKLFVSFTVRGALVRVISARDMNRPERRIYERAQEEA
jgi:uncharacterized DUF497 family protein